MSTETPLTEREIALLRGLNETLQINANQKETISSLEAMVVKLQERIAQLERNSNNSNKPPSSDPPYKSKSVKNTKPESEKGKPGAKSGHQAHQRQAFPQSRIDEVIKHEIPSDKLPDYLVPIEGDLLTYQQVSCIKAIVTEHQIQRYLNTRTGEIELAPHPKGLGKLLSPEVTAAIASLKTDGRMSISSLQRFCSEVLNLKVSRGCLSQAVTEAGKACAKAYAQIREKLQQSRVIGMDETTHWSEGWRLWMWVAQTPLLTLLRVENTRSADEIAFFLDKTWLGILVSDDMGAYKKWCRLHPEIKRQLCHAHLYREVKGLQEHPCKMAREWADRAKRIYELFWKALKRNSIQRARRVWGLMTKHAQNPPPINKVNKLAGKLIKYETSLLRCLDDPLVPATNNASERALRQVVIQRKLTFGTRSEDGIIAWERIFSLLDTCRKQSLSAYHYLCEAVSALRAKTELPALALGA